MIDEGDACLTGACLTDEDGLDLVAPDEHPEAMVRAG
jgi:hypothetical protein